MSSHGNSDAESANGNVDMCATMAPGKTKCMSAACTARTPASFRRSAGKRAAKPTTPSPGDLFTFGGLRYEHDLFDGFQYQASLTGGMGYKLINDDDTKLTAQVGVGYRRLRPETIDKDSSGMVISRTPLEASGDAIATAGVDFSR